MVAMAHSLPHLISDDLDLYEEHHHLKLASVVLMTKFSSYRALFNTFDPSGLADSSHVHNSASCLRP